ncbi:MAG: glycosyltransferase family 2 protein [Pseudomonadota bacterium]|nr:glycosyltransferase family 2 protein [Pseudomonadota bacterium]
MTQERTMVFIPMYNCAAQISRVIGQFSDPAVQKRFAEIVVIDNRSTDDGVEAAKEALAKLEHVKTTLLRNRKNYGLGGSHKAAFDYALAGGHDYLVVLHGDDQGSIHDLVPHIDAGAHRKTECLLGARFMPGSRLEGYSLFRTFGNIVFNALFSLGTLRVLFDLGAGLNMYARPFLERVGYLQCADDLTFNYTLLLRTVGVKGRFRFFPLCWREDDQISNVKLASQAKRTLKLLLRFVVARKAFMAEDFASRLEHDYTSEVLMERRPA